MVFIIKTERYFATPSIKIHCIMFWIFLIFAGLTPSFQTESDDAFIMKVIISQKSCSTLLILQDFLDNSKSVTHMLRESFQSNESTKMTFFLVKFNLPQNSSLNNNHSIDLIDGAIIAPVTFPVSVSNIRRMNSNFMFVILTINDVRPDFLKMVATILSASFIPITRKDEDYFIFKTKPHLHKTLLLMDEYPNRIKHKIAVGVKSDDASDRGQLKISTMCFYCLPGGYPVLVTFPAIFSQSFNYFPDFVRNFNGKLFRVSIPFVRSKIEADAPYQGTNNAKRGSWKILFHQFLMVAFGYK